MTGCQRQHPESLLTGALVAVFDSSLALPSLQIHAQTSTAATLRRFAVASIEVNQTRCW